MPEHAVKALGDWELDVLGIPYGGPNGGKDADGEYFTPKTALHLDRFDPLVMYYHGYGDDGKPVGEPQEIGRIVTHEKRADGVWFRVLLDKASEWARRVWDGAKNGLAAASSGSIAHLARTAEGGEITNWPMAELSLFETSTGKRPANGYAVALPVLKAIYKQAGRELPDLRENEPTEGKIMEPQEVEQKIEAAVKAALEARDAQAAQKADQERLVNERVEAAVKAEREKVAEAAKTDNRLPGMPNVRKHTDIDKYDDLDPGQHAFLVDTYEAMRRTRGGPPISDEAIKALAMKMESEAEKGSKPSRDGMKALRSEVGDALKAYEINYSTYSSYGSNWVGTLYHTDLWQKIRAGTWVLQALERQGDVRQIPDGYSSDTVPLETTDPTWYKVPEAVAHDATSGRPVATITSSLLGTSSKNVTLAKMGCRVIFSGELVEDSLIAWVPNAYRQIQISGQEQMEHAIIDGDTSSANTTNINDIGGQPAGSELFTLVDGFRKLGLVTNTGNSRDGGALSVDDYLATLALMGTAGVGGSDPSKVSFIVDPWTYNATMSLAEVRTRDVFSGATIESGRLTSLWGYPLYRSYFMHYAGVSLGTVTTAAYQLKANAAGKVDQDTEANNTKGAILAVNWSQWALRWKRRMTIEVSRWPEADANQIVAMLRWGLGYRDTDAAAISYDITV